MWDVVPAPEFILELGAQVKHDRVGSRPSLADFNQYEMPRILAFLALHWDRCGRVDDNSYYRTYWTAGLVVPAYVVTGHMMGDGRIELINISIDWEFDPDHFDD